MQTVLLTISGLVEFTASILLLRLDVHRLLRFLLSNCFHGTNGILRVQHGLCPHYHVPGDLVVYSISFERYLPSLTDTTFLLIVLLQQACRMAYSRLSVFLIWAFSVAKVDTTFSIEQAMPVIPSLNVAWLTGFVLSARMGRFCSPECSLDTMWSKQVPNISSHCKGIQSPLFL